MRYYLWTCVTVAAQTQAALVTRGARFILARLVSCHISAGCTCWRLTSVNAKRYVEQTMHRGHENDFAVSVVITSNLGQSLPKKKEKKTPSAALVTPAFQR